MSSSRPFQPHALKEACERRAQRAIDLTRAGLDLLNARTEVHPGEKRVIKLAELLEVIRTIDPKGLHRSNFSRNPELAAARGMDRPVVPDFSRFANWPLPHRFSVRQAARRRRGLERRPRWYLAYLVVGLGELQRHYQDRWLLLEHGGGTAGSWPENLPYPNPPFEVGEAATRRYHQLQTRERAASLIMMVITLEQQAAEMRAHLDVFDVAWVKRRLEQLRKAMEDKHALENA